MWRRRWVGLAPTVGRGREVWGGGRAVGVYGGEGGGGGGGEGWGVYSAGTSHPKFEPEGSLALSDCVNCR